MNPNEREILETIKRESKKDECKRVGCSNKVLDKRRTYCKEGFCSYDCIIEDTNINKSQEEKERDEKREREKEKQKIEKDERRERERIEYEERKRKEKIEKIGNWRCYFHKYKGQTYNEIFEKDRGFLMYLHEYVKELNERIAEWIEYKCG